MNNLKKLAIAAALSLVGLTSAFANGTYVPMDIGLPGDFDNTWTFNSAAFGETGPLNTDFADYFLFNVPDDEYVSFDATGATVRFYGFDLYSLGADPQWIDGLATDPHNHPHSLVGGDYLLTSGTYELDLSGFFSSQNGDGTYGLQIFGTPAVPEPASWALMLAGLGAMVSIARRRRDRA